MSKISSALILVTCLSAFSCGTGSSESTGTQQAEISQKVKAPKIDIQTAVLTGDLDAINQHIKAGTDLNQKEPMGGSSPLISASLFGKTDIVKALIDAGADINQKNNEGSTALHTATFFCNKDIVQILLENNADKSILNDYGSTALSSISGPFAEVKGLYEMFGQQLAPLGLKMDLEMIEKTRPEIAEMLK